VAPEYDGETRRTSSMGFSLEHWNGAFFVANPRSPSLPP